MSLSVFISLAVHKPVHRVCEQDTSWLSHGGGIVSQKCLTHTQLLDNQLKLLENGKVNELWELARENLSKTVLNLFGLWRDRKGNTCKREGCGKV